MLILIVLWGSLRSIQNKRFRYAFLFTALCVCSVIGVYYFLAGKGTQNISRVFTIINYNSTFYGRLLYDIDGIGILLKYPYGLGYMGYFYVQHMLQTGVYTVRFVHNEFLQIGLDYGVVPMFLFTFYMVWQVIKGSQSVQKKEVLVLILAASVVDFHLQYMIIDFIVVLCLDLGKRTIRQKKIERAENGLIYSFLLCVFLFCLIPYSAIYHNKEEIALQFMPNNTEALRMFMMKTENSAIAYSYAEKILQNNSYVAEAYNVKAYVATMENDIEQVIKNQDMILCLEKYDVSRYYSYDLLLEQLALQCKIAGRGSDTMSLS